VAAVGLQLDDGVFALKVSWVGEVAEHFSDELDDVLEELLRDLREDLRFHAWSKQAVELQVNYLFGAVTTATRESAHP
jgi:hypothetical protein